MSKANVVQNAFNAGELSPDVYGRTDIDRYRVGCRRLENMVVKKAGGVVRRPGTMFDFELPASATENARFTRFDDGTDQWLLMLQDGWIYFYILDSTNTFVEYIAPPSLIPNEMSSWTTGSDDFTVDNVHGEMVFLGQSTYEWPFRDSMGPYRISAVDSPETGGAPAALPNNLSAVQDYWVIVAGRDIWDHPNLTMNEEVIYRPFGPGQNLYIWLYTTKAGADARGVTAKVVPGSNGAGYMKFELFQGQQLKLWAPYLTGELDSMQFHQEGNKLYISSYLSPIRVIEKLPTGLSLADGSEEQNPWTTYTIDETLGPYIRVSAINIAQAQVNIDFDTDRNFWVNETLKEYPGIPSAFSAKERTIDERDWVIAAGVDTAPTTNAPFYVIGRPLSVGGVTWDYASVTKRKFFITRDSPFGGIVSDGTRNYPGDSALTFVGYGLAWNQFNEYPKAITSYQGRLVAVGGYHKNRAYVSSVGPFIDFCPFTWEGLSDVAGPQSFEVDVIGDVDSKMTAVAEMRSIFLIGTEGVWAIDAGGGAISTGNQNAIQINAYGGSEVRPVRVEQMLVYCSKHGDRLYGITLKQRQIDDYYSTMDVSILNDHMLRPYIAQLAYQQEPNSAVWVRLESGNLVNIALVERDSINGWSRHRIGPSRWEDRETDGPKVKDMVVFDDYSREHSQLYMIVERSLDAGIVWYLEHMANFHTDESVDDPELIDYVLTDSTVSGTATGTTVTAAHLPLEEVYVIYDGVEYDNNPVTLNASGQAVLTGVADNADYTIGYIYDSIIEPMVPVPASGGGAGMGSEGSLRDITSVVLQLQKSMGGFAGELDGDMEPIEYPEEHDATKVFNGQIEVPVNLDSERELVVAIEAETVHPLEVDMLVSRVDVQVRGGE